MLRKTWIVLGAVALVTVAYITAFAVEEVQQPIVTDDTSGGAAAATTWTVCSSGCDFTSIQSAVDAASGGDTIELGPETFEEHVVVANALTIRGAGPDSTVVDGNGSGTVFHTDLPGPILLADMSIQNGATGVAARQVQIDNCIIRGNTASGVYLWGSGGTITDSLITQNTGTSGGGVHFRSVNEGSLTITRSIISRNSASGFGGGVSSYLGPGNWGPELVIDSTLITGNSAAEGGGISCELCTAVISNSTVSGNTAARSGGGIFAVTTGLTVYNSTIAGNQGEGIGVGRPWKTVFKGSIVAGNSPVDCYVPSYLLTSAGDNLSSDATCNFDAPGDMENTDPLLVPLADNGGPTATHALAPGSPAIDAAGDDCLPTDQRGVMRPQDGDGDGVAKCDIGAYELDVRQVAIDIKPQSIPNAINPYSRGVIPVAILGSDTFDVADVDVTKLAFGLDAASPAHNLTDSFTYNDHLQDVNLDGYTDLVTHYRTGETGIICGDMSATLTGVMTTQIPCIDFTPSTTPVPGTVVAKGSSTTNCDTEVIDLIVSDVPELFGAAFDMTYAADLASFRRVSIDGSVLSSDGAEVAVLAKELQPGRVTVGISRLAAQGVDVVGDQLLIHVTLNRFGTEGTGELSFTNSNLLDSGSPPQPIPGIAWFGGILSVAKVTGSRTIEGTDSIVTVGCRSPRRPGFWYDEERDARPRSDGVVNIEKK